MRRLSPDYALRPLATGRSAGLLLTWRCLGGVECFPIFQGRWSQIPSCWKCSGNWLKVSRFFFLGLQALNFTTQQWKLNCNIAMFKDVLCPVSVRTPSKLFCWKLVSAARVTLLLLFLRTVTGGGRVTAWANVCRPSDFMSLISGHIFTRGKRSWLVNKINRQWTKIYICFLQP